VALDTPSVVIMGMLVTLSVVALAELRFMRKRRRKKGAKKEDELPDRAHNAIITTKAIRDTLERGGVRSEEADDVIREAEAAIRERHFRVAVELTEKAKSLMRQAKLRREQQGDLAKLDQTAKRGPTGEDAVTEKERLMKEMPPNYMQSKFSMNLAQDDITAAKARGQNTSDAERFLADAHASFGNQDYDEALKHAVRSRRALEGASTEPAPAPPTPPPSVPAANLRICPSCGAPLASDDAFCRTCGVKAPVPRTCPSCGAEVADDDAFCRKCGASVPLKP